MYKALCIDAGKYDPANSAKTPLHKCDFFGNKVAGERLKKGLALGSSDDPKVALKILTNEELITGSALLEYFEPLYKFLQKENRRMNEEEMEGILEKYDSEVSRMCNKLVEAEWNHVTDLGNGEKETKYQEAVMENAEFVKKNFEDHFEGQNPDDYDNELIKRQIMQVNTIGVDILKEADLKQVKNF